VALDIHLLDQSTAGQQVTAWGEGGGGEGSRGNKTGSVSGVYGLSYGGLGCWGGLGHDGVALDVHLLDQSTAGQQVTTWGGREGGKGGRGDTAA
jgi:hypothetical protein